MRSMRFHDLLVLLSIFSLIWLTMAAPQTKPDLSTTDPAKSGDKLMMGVGITANGLEGKSPQGLKPTEDPQLRYKKVVTDFFSVVTPGNELKWDSMEHDQGQYKLDDAKKIFTYAQEKKKKLRLHTFFAKTQNPPWVDGMNAKDLEPKMKTIMEKVIKEYGSIAIGADICNEILSDQGELGQDNPWFKSLGQDWLKTVYTHAKTFRDQHAKEMLLFINDFGIESINAKSTGMLKIASELKKAKILDGVGFQCHFVAGQVPTLEDFKKNLARFTAAGLKVALTEVDIRIDLKGQPKASEQDTKLKTEGYRTVYDACKQTVGCVSVTTWGVTPQDSWIGNIEFKGFGEATLFDNDYNPTPAMQGLIDGGFFPKGDSSTGGGGGGKP